ncbi:ABC transporter permease [Sphingomonas rubra]|uniref:Phospholipid/cholesterol/gamma-HCH transport system permease protein n=1 Tax=Sphingomonas rubra TaxID=634430 RepID=A0A1I5SBZ6_9SPHN|nr:ABC transporter permease [Sphingomonas rubra]SFP68245.1 phospholipid/cholesterol/gamma-HCH transport system permease protein [Sphingomonas rubra]
MSDSAEFREDQGTVRFSGDLSLARLGTLPERLERVGRVDRVDLSDIDRIDTVGAWVVHRFAARHDAPVEGLSEDGQHLFDQVVDSDKPVVLRPKAQSGFGRVLGEIGDAVVLTGRTLTGLVGFMGATTIALGAVIRHPRRFRFNAVVHEFETVGVAALGILGLMGFLIGMVIAQQGAVQLRQFGAEVFTINLVGRLTLRELGVLMTAIMVAGRSGSAFAAQIGTMKLTEEIDAMRTIGVSPMEALVLPRTMAAVILMPLLGFFTSMVALVGGGLLSWVTLEIPPVTFIARIREVVPITDLYIGLIKAPVFGAIIAIAGCFQGMQVEADAEQVGLRTTSAVVQGIFLVIVLDAFFAVFFSWIGWN